MYTYVKFEFNDKQLYTKLIMSEDSLLASAYINY